MNIQWILLALFLVAVIVGIVRASKRSVTKNLSMLFTVVAAFLITYFIQVKGIFQGVVETLGTLINFTGLLADFSSAEPIAIALAATVAGTFMFTTVFVLLLWILRILVHIVFGIATRKNRKAEANAEAPETAEAPAKKKKVKKPVFYKESGGRRIVSVSAGALCGILVLAVLMMPLFYVMSLASAATHATEDLDADDSQIYKVARVVDTYVVEPYEKSFVGSFYDGIGLSGLMVDTARLGGMVELEEGEVAYADDTLKTLLSHGVSAMAQVTSAKSECKTVKEDVNAIVSDPILSSLLADTLHTLLGTLEIDEAGEDDLAAGLVNNFLTYYKEADKATLQKDLRAAGNAVGVLAEEHILAQVLEGSVEFESLLENEETLGDVVEAISGLSAFGPTLKDAFALGITMMDDTLQIPYDDAEAYDLFMEDLLAKMQRSDDTPFDINIVRYYIMRCQESGAKVSSTNGIYGHSQFVAYVAHWERVQSAFSTAAEDKSYGYFTIEINGNWYIYDKNEKQIFIYDDEIAPFYKDKISPVAGIINALTLRSTQNKLTRANLYAILTAYVASANDPVSVELANRILSADTFVSKAVTTEKMLAAADFTDWTDEEKAKDSRICVDIVLEIMTLIDHLSTLDSLDGIEEAVDMLNEFTLLGDIMDDMKETSCINQLPALLIEGVVKNEAFSDFLRPSTAYQINNIVENNNKTYAECMNQIAGILAWAINSLGGAIGG